MPETVKERPIIFSAPMIQAILESRKTQTRRVVKPQPERLPDGTWEGNTRPASGYNSEETLRDFLPIYCRYGKPGDHLWVRETFGFCPATAYGENVPHQHNPNDPSVVSIYRAGWERVWEPRLRPSIHMPRWASRLTLEIVSVKVERVADIPVDDCYNEGIRSIRNGQMLLHHSPQTDAAYREDFAALWDSINGKTPGASFAENPWCFVIEFKRVEPAP